MTPTPWNHLQAAAYLIDHAALSPHNRVPPGGDRPETLLTVVLQTLTCLRDDLGLGESEADRAVHHLLQALVPALERVEREVAGNKKGRRQ